MFKHRIHYAWYILIGCCILQAGCGGIIYNCAGIFFTPICETFGFNRGSLSSYFAVQGIAQLIALPFAGKIISKYNIRVVLSTAMIVIVIAFSSMSQFTEVYQWYISGAFIGICGAFLFVIPAPIMLGNWFYKKTGMVIGIAGACSGVGGLIFNVIGTAIIVNYGWQTAYIVLSLCSIMLILPFTVFVFRFRPEERGLRPYGADGADTSDKGFVESIGISRKDALKSSIFYIVFIAGVCIGLGSGFVQHFPSFALDLNFTVVVGTAMISAAMVGCIVGKLIFGWLNDRIGTKRAINYILLAVIISMLLCVICQFSAPILIFATFLNGPSMGLASVGVPLIVRAIYGTKDYSVILSYIVMGSGTASALAVSIIGITYDCFGNYIPAFIGGIILYGITILLISFCFMRGKKLIGSPLYNEHHL